MDFPSLPDHHAIAVVLLAVVALALFTRDNIPLETSSMVVVAALTLGSVAALALRADPGQGLGAADRSGSP